MTTATKADDRYRINQTTETISESFFAVAREYGITTRIAVDEQLAICRALAAILKTRSGPLRRSDILAAFGRFGVRRPPNGFAGDLVARLERLDPAR